MLFFAPPFSLAVKRVREKDMGYSFAPVNDRNGLIAMCVMFPISSTTAVVLRFYARKFKGQRFQADDWLIAISLV